MRRYLKHRPALAREALGRLLSGGRGTGRLGPGYRPRTARPGGGRRWNSPLSLNEQRLNAVVAASCVKAGPPAWLDLGCGEGRLLSLLERERAFTRLVGMDVSPGPLAIAARRLHLERQTDTQRERLQLLQGSLLYRDGRLAGFDAAALVEVIEHLDPPRLAAAERSVWEFARPGIVVVTTPNREYNARFENLPAGKFRHRDHRFEWTRAEFQGWAEGVADRFGYTVRFLPVGPVDAALGAPTQMGIFTRSAP